MKVFAEMASMVTKGLAGKLELVEAPEKDLSNNLYQRLFKGVSSGAWKTDEQAAWELYQTTPDNKKYLMLKRRLKDRMINTLFVVNHKNRWESEYQAAVFQCNRNYFCARVLIHQGARSSAIAMAKSTLSLAQRFDLNEIAYLCSRMLRSHFANLGRKPEHGKYEKLVTEYVNLIRAENRAEYMYESLVAEFALSKAFKPEMDSIAKDYFHKAKELVKFKNSFHLNLHYYRIGMLYYQIIRNFPLLLNLCNRYESFLEKHPSFHLSSRSGEVAVNKMVCCMNMKNYEGASEGAMKALQFFNKGSNNWFVVMEHYFLLLIHTSRFSEAAHSYLEVTGDKRFHLLNEIKKEAWRIYEAYLSFLLPDFATQRGFRLMKFINEVPNYSKDKGGFYPAILIAQMLFMLDRWEEDKLEKVIEALRVFSARHLKTGKAPRTTLFIKMVRQLVHHNYNAEKVAGKTAPYLQRLRESDIDRDSEIDSMEIIPYDTVWNTIIERLRKSRKTALR